MCATEGAAKDTSASFDMWESVRHTTTQEQIRGAARYFSSWFWRSKNKREKREGCNYHCERRKIVTNRHLFLAKEEFVFLYFAFSFENNLYCVIMIFGCIEVFGSE
jgi:hypothetical protein